MSPETHSQMAHFIWGICNLLRGPYKRNEYRKVILPLTVLRRFDCLLAPTKDQVLDEYKDEDAEQIILGDTFTKDGYDRKQDGSKKKNEAVRIKEIEAGKARQQTIRELLQAFGEKTEQRLFKDRIEFLTALKAVDKERGVRLSASELRAVLNALGERDETAEICRLPARGAQAGDRNGEAEPDTSLRDTENVPLKEVTA